tara:strand:+ start:138 stop:248 length:111 start_codon:yes stop_codon:yes gene_type:complete
MIILSSDEVDISEVFCAEAQEAKEKITDIKTPEMKL